MLMMMIPRGYCYLVWCGVGIKLMCRAYYVLMIGGNNKNSITTRLVVDYHWQWRLVILNQSNRKKIRGKK